MYPHERSLVKQLSDKPFVIIGINSDQNLEQIRSIVKEKNLTWRSFQNEGGEGASISDQWQVQAWPTLYILDAEGKIRYNNPGRDTIDSAITTLLSEMGHDVSISHNDGE